MRLQLFFIIIGIAFLMLNYSNQVSAQDEKVVVIHTKSGKLVIELFPEDAPSTVDNFLKLAESGFYNRTVFHRVIDGFMIQGGDPLTKPGAYQTFSQWGTGDAGYNIPAEFNSIKHNRGIVSMARSNHPDSASSQFFIVHKDSNFLDGQYTVFGRLVTQESYDTLDKIATLDTDATDLPFKWATTEITKTEILTKTQIPDILDFGEPQRSDVELGIGETSEGVYTNKKLGISFIAPEGWVLQEPRKAHAGVPDVVAVGPSIGGINPSISLTIVYKADITLEQKVAESREITRPAVESGQLTIVEEEKTKINNKDAFITNAVGVFIRENSTTDVQFQEVIIESPEKFYTFTYSNSIENYPNFQPNFAEAINSFKILKEEQSTNGQESDNGGGCLIATAAYGSELSSQIQELRELRDNTILQTKSGSIFIEGFNQMYYSFSPAIADLERQNSIFRESVRISITPLLTTLSLLNYFEIDSEAEIISYGISIIFLNVGMYFIAPLVLIQKFRKSNLFNKIFSKF